MNFIHILLATCLFVLSALAESELPPITVELPSETITFTSSNGDVQNYRYEISYTLTRNKVEQKELAQETAEQLSYELKANPNARVYVQAFESSNDQVNYTASSKDRLTYYTRLKNQNSQFDKVNLDTFENLKKKNSLAQKFRSYNKKVFGDRYRNFLTVAKGYFNGKLAYAGLFTASLATMSPELATIAATKTAVALGLTSAGFMLFNPAVQTFLTKKGPLEKFGNFIKDKKVFSRKSSMALGDKASKLKSFISNEAPRFVDEMGKFMLLEYMFLGVYYSIAYSSGIELEVFKLPLESFMGLILYDAFRTSLGQGSLETTIAKITKWLINSHSNSAKVIQRVSDSIVAISSVAFVTLAASQHTLEWTGPALNVLTYSSVAIYAAGKISMKPFNKLSEFITFRVVGNLVERANKLSCSAKFFVKDKLNFLLKSKN